MSPSDADVRRQLDRLLASAVFANAGRMSRFLRFVVEKKLAGEGERLKEYVIGVEVFDRAADYDPRVDSIVRVEAARLRAKLAEYYAGEGSRDTVVLGLPKGGYAPVVTLSSVAPPATAELPPIVTAAGANEAAGSRRGWVLGVLLVAAAAMVAVVVSKPWSAPADTKGLRVAVMPFAPPAGDAAAAALATHLTEGVTAELVRAGRFAVVASSAARAAYLPGVRPRELAATLDADVLIEARIERDGERVRVEARAADGRHERKLWVGGFAGTTAESDALEREIATEIAAALSRLEPAD
jgi:TolB-like protein